MCHETRSDHAHSGPLCPARRAAATGSDYPDGRSTNAVPGFGDEPGFTVTEARPTVPARRSSAIAVCCSTRRRSRRLFGLGRPCGSRDAWTVAAHVLIPWTPPPTAAERRARHVESRMCGGTHVRFGGRARETDRGQPGHRARARPNRSNTTVIMPDRWKRPIIAGHALRRVLRLQTLDVAGGAGTPW
jgi:hypothetical protein